MPLWTQAPTDALAALSGQLPHLVPELALGLGITALVVLDALAPKRLALRTGFVVVLLLALLGWLLWRFSLGAKVASATAVFFFFDRTALSLKALSVLLTLAILPSWQKVPALNRGGEGLIFLLGLLFGAFITLSARHMLALFLGVEVLSLSAYLLTAYVRTDLKATEATIKYLIFGTVASALMLYGASLLYGLTGSLYIDSSANAIGPLLSAGPVWPALIGMVLVAGGLFYKLSAAPFHFYVPDVFEAVSPPLVAIFGTVPKLAATLALARLVHCLSPNADLQLYFCLAIGAAAALSLIIGNTGALAQNSFLRLMAYSSIAHTGFALLPLAVGSAEGLAAAVAYQALIAVLTFGAIMAAHWLMIQRGDDQLASWQGMGRVGVLGGSFAVLLLGLTGLPPTIGFWAKLNALLPLVSGFGSGPVWFAVLFVAGLIATIVALAVYFRVASKLFFNPSPAKLVGTQPPKATVLLALAVVSAMFTLGLGLWGASAVFEFLRAGFAR